MAITSVFEYFESLNAEQKRHIGDFIKFMNAEYPQLPLKISFSMPMWLAGRRLVDGYVAVSAAKDHFSIHFSDEEFVNHLAESLPSCKKGRRCVKLQYGDALSFDFVKESVHVFLNRYGVDRGVFGSGAEEIGCCGAYCKTCREFLKTCKGCKPGYLDGTRDLRRAKCKMKQCCLAKGHRTCVDCAEYDRCDAIQEFMHHPGYKYSKYRQALEFIRAHGYAAFIKAAQNWKNAYGKYESDL